MIRRWLAYGCSLLAPWVWSAFRRLEQWSGVPPLAEGPRIALPARPALESAVLGGPGIYSLIDGTGLVHEQRGGGLVEHGIGPQGWTGLRLPRGSELLRVVQAVAVLQEPCSFELDHGIEGVRYSGIAYPWDGKVAVIALPPLYHWVPDASDSDENVAALQRIAVAARQIVSQGEVPHAVHATSRALGA